MEFSPLNKSPPKYHFKQNNMKRKCGNIVGPRSAWLLEEDLVSEIDLQMLLLVSILLYFLFSFTFSHFVRFRLYFFIKCF